MKEYLRNIYSKLLFLDVAVYGDTAWFCNVYFSALFEISLKDGDIKMLSFLPADNQYKFNSYAGIAYCNGKVIIAPRNEHRILIYDLKNNKIENQIEIDVSMFKNQEDIYNLFSNIFICNNKAYLVPGRYPGIIELNLENFCIRTIDEWYLKTKDKIRNLKSSIAAKGTLSNGCIYIPYWQSNIIIKYNVDKDEYDIISIELNEKGISDLLVSVDENKLLVANYDNWCIKEIVNGKTVREHSIIPENFKGENGIKYICGCGSHILAFPIKGNMIIKYDLTDHKLVMSRDISDTVLPEMEKVLFVDNSIVCAKLVENQKILACSLYEGKILKYDIQSSEWKDYDLLLPELYENEVAPFVKPLYFKEMMNEQGKNELEDWLKYIINK